MDLVEQPIPVQAAVDGHRPKQGGDRRGGQHSVRGDLPAAAVEGLENPGHHVHRTQHQQRPLRRRSIGVRPVEAVEVDPPVQQRPQLIERQSRGGVDVWADRGGGDEVGHLPGPQHHQFSIRSGSVDAELSDQNPRSRDSAFSGSPSTRADQASNAHIAPPEVPLTATILWPAITSGCSSRPRTPAVKAVWLPPPWQAIATRTGSTCRSPALLLAIWIALPTVDWPS